MNNLRIYGSAPYEIALIHGGPGAPGSMAPVARELSKHRGILEPLQTRNSVDGQVSELKDVLETYGELPTIFIGSSWGAMLGYIFAARHPSLVKKLIMVGSGVFKESYAESIMNTRLNRMNETEAEEVSALCHLLEDRGVKDKDNLLSRLGKIMTKADAYNPLTLDTETAETFECSYDIHKNVWQHARELRISGKLLELGKDIRCPVVAIHGQYDPHPAAGVREPLASVLENFKFFLLERCGHLPWLEKDARETFFELLLNNIS